MIGLYRERGGNNIPVWNLEITFMVNCLSGHFSLFGNSKVTSYKLVSEIVREEKMYIVLPADLAQVLTMKNILGTDGLLFYCVIIVIVSGGF